ncbi:MAG: hypothetical protein K6E63_05145 [Lachnospiraceae bacterium]|nr:hypothetical protein [Lachnospiraceae bacterium]
MSDLTEKNMIRYLELAKGYVDEDDLLWFCPLKFNSLFSYNLVTGETLWRGFIPDEPRWHMTLYRDCIKYKDRLYMIPYNANGIAVYSFTDGEFEKIKINDFGVKTEKISGTVIYGNKLFLFGEKIPCILILDCDTGKLTYFDKLHKELDKIAKLDVSFYFTCTAVSQGNLCYLTATKLNALVIFNMDDNSYKITKLGDSKGIYNNLLKKDDFLFLIPGNHRKFAVWDIKNNKLRETEKEINKPSQYYSCYYHEGSFYALPNRADSIVGIKVDGDEVSFKEKKIDDYYDIRFCGDPDTEIDFCKFRSVYEDGSRILYFCLLNRELYILDKSSGDINHSSIIMDTGTRMSIAKVFYEKYNILMGKGWIKENSLLDLEVFVEEAVVGKG